MAKKNINKMSIQEILREVTPWISIRQLTFIGKNPEKMKEDLLNMNQKLDDINGIDFLIDHSNNVDKEKLVLMIASNLRIKVLNEKSHLDDKEFMQLVKQDYAKCLELLKGSKAEIPIIVEKDGLYELESFMTVDELYDREHKRDMDLYKRNLQIIDNLEKVDRMPLEFIVSICNLKEFEDFICYNKSNSHFFQHVIINNAKIRTDEENIKFVNLVDETSKIIKQYPDKFNIEKLLLVSSYHAKYILENGVEDSESQLYSEIMLTANENIMNRKTKISGDMSVAVGQERKFIQYSTESLEEDVSRIIEGKYFSKKDLQIIKNEILSGEREIDEIKNKRLFKLLQLNSNDKKKMMQQNPKSIDTFLKFNALTQEVMKEYIDENDELKMDELDAAYLLIRDIIKERDLVNIYMKNGLNLEEMMEINEMFTLQSEIQIEEMIDYYFEAKNDSNKLKKFERYSLLFREIQVKDKTEEEKIQLANEIMEELYKKDSDYEKDLKGLYKYGLLPIDTLIDWNGEDMIYDLIQSNSLKPKDARELLAKGELSLVKSQDALVHSQLTDAEKMNFIFTSFDGNGKNAEEIEKQNNARIYLMQSVNISKEFKEVGENHQKSSTRKQKSSAERVPRNQYITDPVYRWQLLSEIDEECEQEVCLDGSVIFSLPNVNKGSVIIEKMYKFSKEGLEINYGSATYVMSQEEFYKNKENIIQNKSINRKVLIDMQKNQQADKLIHSSGWGKNLKKILDISQENNYSQEKIQKINQLIAKIEEARELM